MLLQIYRNFEDSDEFGILKILSDPWSVFWFTLRGVHEKLISRSLNKFKYVEVIKFE